MGKDSDPFMFTMTLILLGPTTYIVSQDDRGLYLVGCTGTQFLLCNSYIKP